MLGLDPLADAPVHGAAPIPWSGPARGYPRGPQVWLEGQRPEGGMADDALADLAYNDTNGLVGIDEVPVGGVNSFTVNPNTFVRFDRPGRWTLRVFHDAGMGPSLGDADPRWASATVDLMMPDVDDAVNVLVDHDLRLIRLLRRKSFTDDGKPCYAAMTQPVYLPLLIDRARAGSRLVFAGLSGMSTTAAADALLALLSVEPIAPPPAEAEYGAREHPWGLALAALSRRLPPTAENVRQGSAADMTLLATLDANRRARVQERALALAQSDSEEVRVIAVNVLAQCHLGIETFMPMLERVLRQPRDSSGFHELLAAIRATDAPPHDPAASDGAAMAWLDHLLWHQHVRPAGWQDQIERLLTHPAPRIREWALMLIPRDNRERWRPYVAKAFTDDDEFVRSRAVNAASDYPGPGMIPLLQAAMLRETTPETSARIIGELAGRPAEAAAWVASIAEGTQRSATTNGLHSLFRVIGFGDVRSDSTTTDEPDAATRAAIAERLRAFLASHREELQRGPLTAPDVTWPADLLPEGWNIVLADGTTWPK